MKLTIFGLVWMTAVIYALYRKHPRYIIDLVLLSGVFQAASVFVIGNNGVGPMIVTSIIVIVWCFATSMVFNYGILRISLKDKIKWMSFLGVFLLIGVIVISRKINYKNYNIDNSRYILLFLQLFIYVVCYMCLWKLSKRISREEIQKTLYKIIFFVLIIGIVQLLITTGIFPRNPIVTTFLYTPDTNSAYYWFNYYPRIFSTFMEPSYCAAFLVGAFYYVISDNRPRFRYKVLAIVLVCEILLTLSSTAYGAFAIVGVVYLMISKNKKALRYLIPIGLSMIFLLEITGQMMPMLDRVIFNKINTGSWHTRANADSRIMEQFFSSPIIGNGYKNGRGSQFWVSLLGQLGLLGLISWMMIWGPILYKTIKQKNDVYLIPECLFLVSVICSMFIAIPDMDFCVFWCIMYVLALLCGNSDVEKENV